MTREEWLAQEAEREELAKTARAKAEKEHQTFVSNEAKKLENLFFAAIKDKNPWHLGLTDMFVVGSNTHEIVRAACLSLTNLGWNALDRPVKELEGDFPGASEVTVKGQRQLVVYNPKLVFA